MGLRVVVGVVCLAALVGCPAPPTPVLGFPGPLPIERWDTTFGNGIPLSIYYPAETGGPTPRPVVIFSAGWNQMRGAYLGYGKELAQWGYVAIIRAYPNPSLWGIGIDTFEQQTQQVSDILDWCAEENARAGSPLFGSVDVTHAGTAGHSFGAAVSVESALHDPRIGAVVDLDSIALNVNSEAAAALTSQLANVFTPMLWIGSDKGVTCSGPRDANALPTFDIANAPTEEVIIRGASHIDFLEQGESIGEIICGGGTTDKNEIRAIASRYMISWFNVFLQRKVEFRTYLDGALAQEDVAAGKVSIRTKDLGGA